MADAMYVLSSDCKMRPSEQKLATPLWAGDEDGRGRFIQGVAHSLACSFHQLILHDAHTGKIG